MRNAQGEVAKYKVRLVARGDLQDPSTYGDTYAGAAQRKSVMLLLNLANYYDWQISTADITTAFLYGTLDAPIYWLLGWNTFGHEASHCLASGCSLARKR